MVQISFDLSILIVQLYRIQSETLHNQFQAQRSKVQRRLQEELEEATGSGGGARGVRRPTTRLLFHGTKEEVHKKILLNGFDRSHAGVNGELTNRGCAASDARF